jgi:hypothetical protein
MKKQTLIITTFVILALLAGCMSQLSGSLFSNENPPTFATPTAHQLFSAGAKTVVAGQAAFNTADSIPTMSNHFEAYKPVEIVVETPAPTPTWIEVKATRPPAQLVPLYNDWVKPGWQILSSDSLLKVDPRAKGNAHLGNFSISVQPSLYEGKVYIVSAPENDAYYLRKDVLGVSLYLYSGSAELNLNDLALTVIGSDAFSYYRADDLTVLSRDNYEETTLNFLGFNNSIPPRTWVEVEIWLDEMLYEPDYHFVTGLYIVPRKSLTHTIYIDDVNLIVR